MAAPTESSRFWTTGGAGDGSATYTRDQLAEIFRNALLSDFTTQGVLNGLAVSGTASPLTLATGASCVYGFLHFCTVAGDLTIATPVVGTTGWHVVLRAGWTAQTVRAVAVRNTDGVSAVPSLTQVAGTTWEIRIASGTITTAGVISVTDARTFAHWPGRIDRNSVDGGTATHIPYFDANGRLTNEAALQYDATNNRLGVGVSAGPDYLCDFEATDATATRTGAIGAEIAVQNSSTGGVRSAGLRLRTVDSVSTVRSAARILGSFLGATYDDSAVIFQTADGSETFRDVMVLRGDKVGIGDTTPDYALDVVGQVEISPASAAAPIVLGANGQGQKVTGLNADQIDGLDLAFGRRGGDATDWDTEGTTAYTPTNLRRAVGAISWTGALATSGSVNVTFPTAFSAKPIVIPVRKSAGGGGVFVSVENISTTGCTIYWTSATSYTLLNFLWSADGPA